MLNFRLHELDPVVDVFLLIESPFTHQGKEKEITFEKNKFKFVAFKDKILHLTHNVKPHPNPWINEKNLRNAAISGIEKLKLSARDYIGISDIDEIPDSNILHKIKTTGFKGFVGFMHNFYYYNINCRKRNKWFGSVYGTVEDIYYDYNFELNELRYDLKRGNNKINVVGYKNFNAGGWHFSYFGKIDTIIEKLESFTHSEYNTPEYKDINHIKAAIKEGRDLFKRGEVEDMDIIKEIYLPKRIDLLPSLFV